MKTYSWLRILKKKQSRLCLPCDLAPYLDHGHQGSGEYGSREEDRPRLEGQQHRPLPLVLCFYRHDAKLSVLAGIIQGRGHKNNLSLSRGETTPRCGGGGRTEQLSKDLEYFNTNQWNDRDQRLAVV